MRAKRPNYLIPSSSNAPCMVLYDLMSHLLTSTSYFDHAIFLFGLNIGVNNIHPGEVRHSNTLRLPTQELNSVEHMSILCAMFSKHFTLLLTLSYTWALKRDCERLEELSKRVDVNPLGR